MPYKDKEIGRQRAKARYMENRDRILEQKHEYYRQNRKQKLEWQVAYHHSHREHEIARMKNQYSTLNNHCVYLLELSDCRMYVGSTSHLNWRIRTHKRDSEESPDRLLYKAIRETGGWNQVKIHILMKDIPDKDLRIRLEQHFIDMVPDELSLNTQAAMA